MSQSSAPSPLTVQKAWRLGRSLAMTDPSIKPDLEDAANFPNYVLFMLSHRKKMETMPSFWTWDMRLEDIIEDEIDRHGITLSPENVEEVLRVFAMPLRCAFWFGWEQVQNLEERYEKTTGRRNTERATTVTAADIQATAADTSGLTSSLDTDEDTQLDPSARIVGAS